MKKVKSKAKPKMKKPDVVRFENGHGVAIEVPASFTLADLARSGLSLRLVPKNPEGKK